MKAFVSKDIKNEVEKFVTSIRDGYTSKWKRYIPLVKRVIHGYSENNDHDFVQVPDRVIMDKDDFSGNVDNTFLGQEIGEAIFYGEFNYVLKKFSEEVETLSFNEFNYNNLFSLLLQTGHNIKPKAILIPLDYYDTIHNWVPEGAVKYINSKLWLDIGSNHLEVIWSNNYMSFNQIFLIGHDCIELIYKRYSKMLPITSMGNYISDFNKEEDILSIIFNKIDGKVDFVARTVLTLKFDSKKVIVININK